MEHDQLIDEIQCNSKDKHIVLFSNYRTGSTVLGLSISTLMNLKYFPEVFLPNNTDMHDKLWKSINYGRKVLISIQGDQFNERARYFLNHKFVLGNCYSVKLYRKNFIDQLTSFYIANKIGKFSHYAEDLVSSYEVAIDYSLVNECFNHILESNKLLDSLTGPFDLTLTYEEHVSMLATKLNSKFLKTPVPKNYKNVRDEILIFCSERLAKTSIF
jgi:hypothetical protein